jgi:hypothetical protein
MCNQDIFIPECDSRRRWQNTREEGSMLVVAYLTCRRCGLKVKTGKRLAVPWDAEDLVDQVKTLLLEGQAAAPRDKGITELPLA